MDIVSVKGLKVSTTIGILDWEKEILQPLVIDLDMYHSCQEAAVSGNIDDALDYAAVSESVRTLLQGSAWGLIETVAEEVAKHIMERFNVGGITICVKKPTAVAEAEYVSVTITRGVVSA